MYRMFAVLFASSVIAIMMVIAGGGLLIYGGSVDSDFFAFTGILTMLIGAAVGLFQLFHVVDGSDDP